MKIDSHEESFEEHKQAIFTFAIDILGIENSQRIIGLHASRGILDLLSIYLLKNKKMSDGMQLNHRWFKSSSAYERLPEFKNKKAIVDKLIQLEILCERLSYGSKSRVEETENAVRLFSELERRIRENEEK